MAQQRSVTSNSYPYLPIAADIRGRRIQAEALVDTGFSGYLVIPDHFLNSELGLPDARIDWGLVGSLMSRIASLNLGAI